MSTRTWLTRKDLPASNASRDEVFHTPRETKPDHIQCSIDTSVGSNGGLCRMPAHLCLIQIRVAERSTRSRRLPTASRLSLCSIILSGSGQALQRPPSAAHSTGPIVNGIATTRSKPCQLALPPHGVSGKRTPCPRFCPNFALLTNGVYRAPPGQGPAIAACNGPARYGRASRIRLNGVSVARRKRVNPPAVTTCRSRSSPAWAPSANPTSCDSDAGVQIIVDAA